MRIFSNRWREIVQRSQSPILSPEHLLSAAVEIEDKWNVPSPSWSPRYTEVSLSIMNQNNFKVMPDQRIGYDMPLLLEADQPISRTIAIVAQDPLRQPSKASIGVSLGTPFAFDCKWYREKAHYGKIWNWIESILLNGCNVYLTDARKLYCDNGEHPIELEIQANVLRDELKLANPFCIATFGLDAAKTLQAMGHDCYYFRHPASFMTAADRDQIGTDLVALSKG